MNNININIAGLGNVGSYLIKYIENNTSSLEKKLNKKIIISGICAKNKNKKRIFSIKNYQWFDDPIEMINESKPDLFIELMGYEKGISYDSIKHSLNNNINVISANKALIAHHGNELIDIADNNKLAFLFEAAVAGGIPIVKSIKDLMVGNNFYKISAILNGTTNYILSNMTEKNIDYKEALEDAQKKGYVESNPDLDIMGLDSAHKISILSSLAFKCKILKFDNIYTEGISKINKHDIEFARQLNYVIKLLSVAKIKDNKLVIFVRPIMINDKSQLAQVNDVLNGIQIYSQELGEIFFEGKGAGGEPTTNSIVSDIIEYNSKKSFSSLGIDFKSLRICDNLSIDNEYSSYYIRMEVADKPGVLANITSLLKDNNISIETLIQNPQNKQNISDYIPLVFTTHETYFKNMNECIKKISLLEAIKNTPIIIQIEK